MSQKESKEEGVGRLYKQYKIISNTQHVLTLKWHTRERGKMFKNEKRYTHIKYKGKEDSRLLKIYHFNVVWINKQRQQQQHKEQ
jgi:hypothetical protein